MGKCVGSRKSSVNHCTSPREIWFIRNDYELVNDILIPMIIVIQKHHFEYLRLRRCTVKQFYVSERKEKEYQVDQILCTFYRDTFNVCKKYNEWC